MSRSGFSIFIPWCRTDGAVAQLGEHLLCKQGVVGSIPISSTKLPQQYEVAKSRRETSGEHNRRRLGSALVFATAEFVDN